MSQIRVKNNMIKSDECHKNNESILATEDDNNSEDKSYAHKMRELEIDMSLLKADEEYKKTGKSFDAKEALDELRRKHFGEI